MTTCIWKYSLQVWRTVLNAQLGFTVLRGQEIQFPVPRVHLTPWRVRMRWLIAGSATQGRPAHKWLWEPPMRTACKGEQPPACCLLSFLFLSFLSNHSRSSPDAGFSSKLVFSSVILLLTNLLESWQVCLPPWLLQTQRTDQCLPARDTEQSHWPHRSLTVSAVSCTICMSTRCHWIHLLTFWNIRLNVLMPKSNT